MTTDPERWQRLKAICGEALDLPEDERTAHVRRACGADTALEREALDFFRSHDRLDDAFLAEPAARLLGSSTPADRRGQRLGAWEIVELLGSGGMGEVYLGARREGGFDQRAAIKLVGRAMPSDDLVRRFEQERKILAALDHTNIARLLDGGTTDDAIPYLVMEYVEGVPLDEYCRRDDLSINQRIDLMLDVCSAVQYAHQNLVIHRDLKPSNVLVTGSGVPKLLDFGIAKLTDAGAGGLTQTAVPILTPGYASPEQLHARPVTTASDVFSLGVLLYVLLTGERPFRTGTDSLPELAALIDTTQPARPSALVDRTLRGRLTGDLDAIALKALRAEPERRYPSVEALADDLRRERERRPVLAREGAFAYRAARFLRRHRTSTAAALGVLLSLVGGLVVSIRQTGIAQAERIKAERINEVLQNMLSAPDASWYAGGTGHDVSMLEVLDAADQWLAQEAGDVPEVEASVRATIGKTYLSLGIFESAERELRRARELRLEHLGPTHPDSAQSAFDLAVQLRVSGAGMDEPGRLYEEALSVCRERADCEADLVPATLIELGVFRLSQGDAETSERHLEEAMARLEARGESAGRLAAIGWNNLGLLRSNQGDAEAAAHAYQQTIDILDEIQVRDSVVAITKINLANLRQLAGDDTEADALLKGARAYSKEHFGDNPYIAFLCGLWASEFAARRGELETILERAPETFEFAERAAIDENNLMLWGNHINYGRALLAAGRLGEAETQLRRSLDILEGQVGRDSWQYGVSNSLLGSTLTADGRAQEGGALLRDAHHILATALGAGHRRTLEAAALLEDAGLR